MNKEITTHQSLNETKKEKGQEYWVFDHPSSTQNDIKTMKIILEEDANIFLLNNLLMSVQFFENYERDVEFLRKNWFKEVVLESHHKKCFYADLLFRLSGEKVKYQPCHGENKGLEVPLHPFRIYISSDNIEAAYDPSVLGCKKFNLWPQYQFTVRTNKTTEKSGFISLAELKTIEAQVMSSTTNTSKNKFLFHDVINLSKTTEQNSNYFLRKSISEEKYNRRSTKTEKFISLQSKKMNQKMVEKNSLKYWTNSNEDSSFYKFLSPEARLKDKIIQDFRMNSTLANSHEIPLECFQKEEIRRKLKTRRPALNEGFRSQKILNSAAFKGYFCDLLIDKLSESLHLDPNAVKDSSILEEFIMVKEKGTEYCFTPIITIEDWNNFVVINKSFRDNKTKQLAWPSDQMQKIINILPCNAVPTGYFDIAKEDLDYEKTWKLVFPKAEEFLLLHMMHAHIRCYFFVLLLYKSFIENKIKNASFGPKHLMHLLFWRVHKNFLAWPEDRPGETLLSYLKILYKKLQKKSLCDFFITSRNLFATSLPKDLHKAQVLIKKIIENPVPYILRAIRNLHLDSDFYPAFDILKLSSILHAVTWPLETLKKSKKKKQKSICFQDDEERRWKKIAMKQVLLERKAQEEKDQTRKGSTESINVENILNFNSQDFEKCNQILEMFTSHFIDMASKSLQYNFLSQAFIYLNQTQKLLELSIAKGTDQDSIKTMRRKTNELKETCYGKLKKKLSELLPTEKPPQTVSNEMELNFKNMLKMIINEQEKLKEPVVKQQLLMKQEEAINENDVFNVKL